MVSKLPTHCAGAPANVILVAMLCVLLSFVKENNLFAQTAIPPAARTTPQTGESARARELAEQLRRTRAAQQSRSRTQDTRQQGLLAMNLSGMETFGDALGNIPAGGDVMTSTYQLTLDRGMFQNVNFFVLGMGGTFINVDVTSLSGGPAIGIDQWISYFHPQQGMYNVVFANPRHGNPFVPSLDDEVIGYLAAGGMGNPNVTVPQGLRDYIAANGVDPAQLSLNTEDSFIQFWYEEIPYSTTIYEAQFAYDYTVEYLIPAVSASQIYGLGRQKITENMTPLPTDRFIFDYSYYHNVPLPYGSMPVNRFTPGIEKTFFNKRCSLEMRFPFSATIDNNLYTDNDNRLNVTRWGDATAILKYLVFKRERLAMTLGLGMSLPLADDTHLVDAVTGREVIRSKNQSVHLMPYAGFLYAPNDKVFFQSYFQVDATAKGDSIYVADFSGNGMLHAGKAKERTYAYTSASVGYWLFRNYCRHGKLQNAMNLMGELHWTQSLDRAAGVRHEQSAYGDSYIFNIGRDHGNYSVLNMTLGTRYIIGDKVNIGIGYAVPLSNNRQFDGELRVTCNRYF